MAHWKAVLMVDYSEQKRVARSALQWAAPLVAEMAAPLVGSLGPLKVGLWVVSWVHPTAVQMADLRAPHSANEMAGRLAASLAVLWVGLSVVH